MGHTPLQIRHDDAKKASWCEHPVRVMERSRHIVAWQMLQHVAAVNSARAAIGDGQSLDNVANPDVSGEH